MRHLRFLAVTCCFALGAGPALAQDKASTLFEPTGWGSFYLGTGYRYEHLEMPRFGLGFRTANPSPFSLATITTDHRPEIDAHGPAAHFGYILRDGTLPPWLGRRIRAELSGWYVTGASTDGQSTGKFNTGIISTLDNRAIGVITTSPALVQIASSLKSTFDGYHLGLRFRSDFELSPSWVLTPELGVVGGNSTVHYSLNQIESGATFWRYEATSKVMWHDIGGTIGMRVTYKATPSLHVHIAGHASIADRHVTFSAGDALSLFGPTVGSTVSGSASRTAYLGGGEVGATFSPGGTWSLGLVGGIQYDSSVPSIRIGSYSVASKAPPPSLFFGGQIGYYVMANATIRLW
jgi:hypothetical protein